MIIERMRLTHLGNYNFQDDLKVIINHIYNEDSYVKYSALFFCYWSVHPTAPINPVFLEDRFTQALINALPRHIGMVIRVLTRLPTDLCFQKRIAQTISLAMRNVDITSDVFVTWGDFAALQNDWNLQQNCELLKCGFLEPFIRCIRCAEYDAVIFAISVVSGFVQSCLNAGCESEINILMLNIINMAIEASSIAKKRFCNRELFSIASPFESLCEEYLVLNKQPIPLSLLEIVP